MEEPRPLLSTLVASGRGKEGAVTRTMILVVLLSTLSACGSADESLPANEPEADDTAGAGGAGDEGTGRAPATTAEGILDRLIAVRSVPPAEWVEETRTLLEPGRLDPLVGMSRQALVQRLGPPDAPDFTRDGLAGWSIGHVPEPSMSHAPILVLELGADGGVTSAHFQLSM